MRIFLSLLFISLNFLLKSQISGVVFDEKFLPLPGATIILLPDSLQTITDNDGGFLFKKVKNGHYDLRTSFIGFVTNVKHFHITNASKTQKLKIYLQPDSEILETVVIKEEHAKTEETLQAEHIHNDFLQKNLEGSFAQTIEKLPGISSINVGVGISKPVIRGLSGNRIIVNHQGIKQESQQWGSDHGLEIDQFDVERVELIKGPGSLQYGSDGLGGVINIMPNKILPKNSYKGSFFGVYKTNNEHWGGSAKLGLNFNNWFISARYSHQEFADYKVPANTFIYNNFELPILNNRLKNTAGIETNLNLTTGILKSWGITRLVFSHYKLNAGLFSGAVGIPRSFALTDDGNYRDIDVPQQNVNHYKVSLNQTLFFGNNHLVFDIGYQSNLRQEFSEPEFHAIPLSQLKNPNDKLAIELLLQTFSIASHYEYEIKPCLKNIIGINAQWQTNQRNGFEYLLPDFYTFRGGIYSIMEKEINDNLLINGGLRLDLGQNETDFFRQFVWDSNENIIDSLTSVATNDLFFNWSASFGSNLILQNGKWNLKANFGKSFRVPYPAETVSNGVHHGTFRHEVGTANLKSEHGYQLDLGASFEIENFESTLSYYFNYFDNYIYLGPTFPAKFSQLPEAGQIFQYRQDNAIYTGFEFQWDWHFLPKLSIKQAIDFVQSYNLETKLALPFTPQPAIKTDLSFNALKFNWFKDFYFDIAHQYHFAATGNFRIDRSENPTTAYQLWDLGIGTNLHFGKQEFILKFQIQNIANTSYLAHLSRYRIINVPEQGRNFVITLKAPFIGSLKN